jgi:hypothetical protein
MNNKICAWTIYDNQNKPYADIMTKMWRHFNPDIEMREFNQEEIAKVQDPAIFYRATPYFTKKLMEEGFEVVIKVDADSFIFGSILEALLEDYDVGVVYNWNRTDYKTYGLVSVCDITPQEYFNCGLVVMKSRKFVDHWLSLCYTPHFERLQYREQDILNLICTYGTYNVKKLDDGPNWYGLISKGENAKFVLRNGKVICPKSQDKYPPEDKCVKVYHVAGGRQENKMQYKILFNEDIQKLIEDIIDEN